MRLHDVDEHASAVAVDMPKGRAWTATRVSGTKTRQLIEGLAETFMEMEAWVKRWRDDLTPDLTQHFIDEWEQAVGIPCECFNIVGTDAERRRDILAKISAMGVHTAQDFVDLAATFGVTIEVYGGSRHGCFPMTFPIILFESGKEARFTVVVWYERTPGTGFPFTFPFRLQTTELAILECFFRALIPANCNLIFREKRYPAPYVVSGKCLEYDFGTWEYLASNSNAGVTDDFNMSHQISAMAWVKSAGWARDDLTVFMLGNPNVGSAPRVKLVHEIVNGVFHAYLYKSGSAVKLYRFGSTGDNVWIHAAFTYDDSTDTLRVYINGVEDTSPDIVGDGNPIFNNMICRSCIGAEGNGNHVYDGRIHQVGLWDDILTPAEVLATYNAGDGDAFDLSSASGNYTSQGNLQHWYKQGLDVSPDLGKDYGLTPVDMVYEYNMSDVDIIADAPS